MEARPSGKWRRCDYSTWSWASSRDHGLCGMRPAAGIGPVAEGTRLTARIRLSALDPMYYALKTDISP